MQAFLSYQTQDRHIAAKVREFLDSIAIPALMAHEDINVSHEWQKVILAEISKADIFIPILSENYLKSPYCMQESGIAIFRMAGITVIPLSTDGSVSPGFMTHIQSKRIDPNNVSHSALFAGIAQYNCNFAIDRMINRLALSRNYASAEANFKLLFPYLGGATDEQIVEILEAAASNKPNSRCWSLRARVPAAFVYNPRAPLSQRGSRQTPKYSTPMGEAYDDFKIDTLPKTPTTWVIGVSRR
jgi:TIR domain